MLRDYLVSPRETFMGIAILSIRHTSESFKNVLQGVQLDFWYKMAEEEGCQILPAIVDA
jgi:hypothetical protein